MEQGRWINSKEAAYDFLILRQYHLLGSLLNSIGTRIGFDSTGERQKVSGAMADRMVSPAGAPLGHDNAEEKGL